MKKSFKLALVTGATSGIGEALCHLLAKQGINLLITGRNQEKLDLLVKQLEMKVKIFAFAADLSKPDHCSQVVKQIQLHTPDLMINNAGLGIYGDAISHSIQDELEIVDVNVRAVLQLTLAAAQALKEKNRAGTICNVASVIAFYVAPATAVYAASKRFVVNVSQSLDFELKPYNIRVLAACPGMVTTDFAKRAGGENHDPQLEVAMTAEFAAEEIWKQIQQDKSVHIFNWKYRLINYISRILPEKWTAYFINKKIKKRLNQV